MAPQKVYRNAAIVTTRVVVPPPIAEPTPPYALAAGSQLNRPSVGGLATTTPLDSGSSLNKPQSGAPWPGIISPSVLIFNSWRPNRFRNVSNHNVPANYGSNTSVANFGFKGREFDFATNYPGPVPNARRPMWNNVIPIIWGLRVINPVAAGGSDYTTIPQSVVSQFTRPSTFDPAGPASLTFKGQTALV